MVRNAWFVVRGSVFKLHIQGVQKNDDTLKTTHLGDNWLLISHLLLDGALTGSDVIKQKVMS